MPSVAALARRASQEGGPRPSRAPLPTHPCRKHKARLVVGPWSVATVVLKVRSMSLSQIRELRTGETGLAHAAMAELRTAFADDRESFVAQVDNQQRPTGYRLLAAFDDEETDAAAVVGFRRLASLAWGDVLYIDDLSTREVSRRRGHGRALLDAIAVEARALGCSAVHLDSGHQRYDAHRVYLAAGYEIRSHHFVKDMHACG